MKSQHNSLRRKISETDFFKGGKNDNDVVSINFSMNTIFGLPNKIMSSHLRMSLPASSTYFVPKTYTTAPYI